MTANEMHSIYSIHLKLKSEFFGKAVGGSFLLSTNSAFSIVVY